MINAVLLPVDEGPVVLIDRKWGVHAVGTVLGSGHTRGAGANWSPSPHYALLMLAATDSDGPANPHGRALGAPDSAGLRGALLVLALSREQRIVSIERDALLAIALRLLIAEGVARQLPPGT